MKKVLIALAAVAMLAFGAFATGIEVGVNHDIDENFGQLYGMFELGTHEAQRLQDGMSFAVTLADNDAWDLKWCFPSLGLDFFWADGRFGIGAGYTVDFIRFSKWTVGPRYDASHAYLRLDVFDLEPSWAADVEAYAQVGFTNQVIGGVIQATLTGEVGGSVWFGFNKVQSQ